VESAYSCVVYRLATTAPVVATLLAFAVSLASGGSAASATTITVTAGKPSEYGFTLSKSTVAVGTVVFKVVNRGKVRHSFAIAGKKTPSLAPGKSGSLSVVFRKAARYAYSSTVPGQAAAGMKGGFVVTAKPAPATPKPAPTPVATQGGAQESTPCASPASTTVSVKMYEFGFIVSPSTVPCGTVRFDVTNTGMIAHTFDVQTTTASGVVAFGGGRTLLPNESTTSTATYTKTGVYQYQCDTHIAEYQMGGSIKVVNG
jgi:plastocyanin